MSVNCPHFVKYFINYIIQYDYYMSRLLESALGGGRSSRDESNRGQSGQHENISRAIRLARIAQGLGPSSTGFNKEEPGTAKTLIKFWSRGLFPF